MKRLVLVGLLVVTGCGADPGNPFPEVTGTMRVACAPFGYSDADIAALIQGFGAIRVDQGYTQIEMIASLNVGGCSLVTKPACFICSASVVDYVWTLDLTEGDAVPPVAIDETPGEGTEADVTTGTPDLPPDVPLIPTASGVLVAELVTGEGELLEEGDTIVVNYTGWLDDGTIFDSGESIELPWDRGSLIDGWIDGMTGMSVGGSRRLVIPPELAYGSEGRPPSIPPDATLTFDVDLLEIL